jgi:hypothetical protein
MKLLLYSGLLYIIIVAIVLTLQPSIMFTADGRWKEFGIGRDPERYTWIPFWLFAILTAIVSYMIVLLIAGEGTLPGIEVMKETVITQESIPIQEISKTKTTNNSLQESTPTIKKRSPTVQEMKPGYYILNAEETAKKGIPKYIYLGPEPPNLIYNHTGVNSLDTE